MKSSRDRLEAVLIDYESLAKKNNGQLRLAIPSKEIWRFFIDGVKQNEGDSEIAGILNNCIKIDTNAPNYTVAEYINKYEKSATTVNKHRNVPSELRRLADAWDLTAEDWQQFTIGDLVNINKAWLSFEYYETNYLKGLTQAFQLIFDFSGEINIDFINLLHHISIYGVKQTEYTLTNNKRSDQFRDRATADEPDVVAFGLMPTNTSVAGLYEFFFSANKTDIQKHLHEIVMIAKDAGNDVQYPITVELLNFLASLTKNPSDAELDDQLYNNFPAYYDKLTTDLQFLKKLVGVTSDKQVLIIYQEIQVSDFYLVSEVEQDCKSELEQFMVTLFRDYEDKISKTNDKLTKLEIISDVISTSLLLHPYLDGNCRVFAMLFLNHLIMRNGFPLAMLTDPNKVALYSKNELIDTLLEGMENTMQLIKTGSLNHITTDQVFAFLNSKELLQPNITYFNEVVAIEESVRHSPQIAQNKESLFLLAVEKGYFDLVKKLIGLITPKSAQMNFDDPSIQKHDVSTSLSIAIQNQHFKIAQYLIRHGDAIGLTGHDVYAELKSLVAATSTHAQIPTQQAELIDTIINGINQMQGDDGKALFYMALHEGNTDIVKHLINNGMIDINEEVIQTNGKAPLHIAARKGDTKMVECLLQMGAKIEMMDNKNRTARDLAQSRGHNTIVTRLSIFSHNTPEPDTKANVAKLGTTKKPG